MNIEGILLRLRAERMELKTKIIQLEKFRGTDEWNKLSVNHKQLIDIQLQAMRTYMEALVGRCLDIEEQLNNKDKDEDKQKENNDENPVKVIVIGLGD